MFRFVVCVNAAFVLGLMVMTYFLMQGVDENNIKGYHCTPITTHTSLESAKAQVRVYQDMVRG